MMAARHKTLRQLEREVIEARLQAFEYRPRATARSLGVSVNTLYNKIRAHGIDYPWASYSKGSRG